MRRRAVELRLDGWEDMLPTLFANQLEGLELEPHGASKKQMLIAALVRGDDASFPDFFLSWFDRVMSEISSMSVTTGSCGI